MLAELRGQVVDQLVAGNTAAKLDASVELAKAAYTRVAESVRAQIEAERPQLPMVPPGASPRAEPNPEELSPLANIASVLTRNGR